MSLVGEESEQFSLSEAVATMSALQFAHEHRGSTDTVLAAAWEKLRAAAHEYGKTHPEEIAAVFQEVEMHRRFHTEEGL